MRCVLTLGERLALALLTEVSATALADYLRSALAGQTGLMHLEPGALRTALARVAVILSRARFHRVTGLRYRVPSTYSLRRVTIERPAGLLG
jgi:hypothetical protein